ncbi:MAG: sugar phosphate isomerase/epimerase [Planctomycetota bacterium]|nr:sugar phosphate isomerase/epimerase [Planctomycetota bacterium]
MSGQIFELAFYAPFYFENFDEYLAALQDLGIRYVGMGMGMGQLSDERRMGRIADAIRARDIEQTALHPPVALVRAGDITGSLDTNRKIIDIAANLGVRSTVWHFRHVHLQGPEDVSDGDRVSRVAHSQLDEMMAEVLPETCGYAADRGIEINLENLPLMHWSRDSSQILDFIRSMNLTNLGFIIDTGHSHANGENTAAVIRAAGSLLRDTHLHDNLGPRGFDFSGPAVEADISGRDLHLIPGLGTLNWIEIIRALREIDFPFPATFEMPGIYGHPDQSVEQWRQWMDLTIRIWRALEDAATFLPDPPP